MNTAETLQLWALIVSIAALLVAVVTSSIVLWSTRTAVKSYKINVITRQLELLKDFSHELYDTEDLRRMFRTIDKREDVPWRDDPDCELTLAHLLDLLDTAGVVAKRTSMKDSQLARTTVAYVVHRTCTHPDVLDYLAELDNCHENAGIDFRAFANFREFAEDLTSELRSDFKRLPAETSSPALSPGGTGLGDDALGVP